MGEQTRRVEKHLLATKDRSISHCSLCCWYQRFLFCFVVFLEQISRFLCAAGFTAGGRNLILPLQTWGQKKTSLFPESGSSKHPPRSLRCSIALIFHLGYTFNVASDGNLLDGDRLQESLAPPSPHRSIIEQPPRRTQRALSLSFVPTKLEPWS